MAIGKGGLGPKSRAALRRAMRKGSKLSKLAGDVKSLKKMVNKTIENKQQTFNNAGINIRDFPLYSRPSLLLTQGSADGDARPSEARIGNSVTLLRTQLNLSVKINPGVTNCRCRVLVVESVNGNEDITMDDVLQAGGGAITGTNDTTYTSCYTTKTDTNKRYKIHFDKVINLSLYDRAFYMKKMVVRYGKTGRVVNYDGNLPTPTDYSGLQILMIGDQTLIAAAPRLAYSQRHTYKDA